MPGMCWSASRFTGYSEPMDTAALVSTLNSEQASLASFGGKGYALSILTSRGVPVPSGICLTTDAYNLWFNPFRDSLPENTEDSCEAFRKLLLQQTVPQRIAEELELAYVDLGEPPVAVRSSATAEDLPDLSFAGLHDSYLNVRGTDALVAAVRDCWVSLWNFRAVNYRHTHNIDNESVAMAVVIQTMVAADFSGVLFTADPVTGNRERLVANSTPGTAEELVAGQVSSATLVLDRSTGEVVEQTGDGLTAAPDARGLADIAAICLDAESILGEPLDVEWAVSDATRWLLQARPITNLPVPNTWEPPPGARYLLRRQVVEHMPGPLSMLFDDLYLTRGLDIGMDRFLETMDLTVNLNDLISRPMFLTVNGYGYCRYDATFSTGMLKSLPRVLWWMMSRLPRFMRMMIPLWRDTGLPEYQAVVERWQSDPRTMSDENLLQAIEELAIADTTYWYFVTMMVGSAKVSEGMLAAFLHFGARGVSTADLLAGQNSLTQYAQVVLEDIAEEISSSRELRSAVTQAATRDVLDVLKRSGNREIALRLEAYLTEYGHLIYDLDFATPTQNENPVPAYAALQAYLKTSDSPGVKSRSRDALRDDLVTRLGPMRRWIFRKLLRSAETYAPCREDALFYMGYAWPTLRRFATELGSRLTAVGHLETATDIYNLTSAEISSAIKSGAPADLADVAAQRHRLREERRRMHPPARVPEQFTIKIGPFDFSRFMRIIETQKQNTQLNRLVGFAVSPGQVTGIATVIQSPDDFIDMQPGTILVCPTTTPAWTPFFTHAAGLVTDIGSVLAHGSIIAREYGIPAVLGTGTATRKIRTGQRIHVDGSSGTVTLL